MNIVTSEFREAIERLLNDLQPSDCVDAEEYRLAREFHALPLGMSLWSYGFLRPDGELISTDWEPNEVVRSTVTQELIRAVVIAAERYPQMAAFVPTRPAESVFCPVCNGTKIWGTQNGKPAECVYCAGLGWVHDA